MDYIFLVASNICIFASLGVSLNLIFGYGNIGVVCSSAFFGIGAYTSALLTLAGWNFFPTMLVAIVIGALLSMVISLPALRVHWDYLVIITIACNILAYQAMLNLMSITGGSFGIRDIPPISLFGFAFESRISYFFLSLAFAIACFLVVRYVAHSMYGTSLMAIGEDELAAKSIGKNAGIHKIMAMAVGMGLSAAAGSLFAHEGTYINCESFTLHDTVLVVSIVIVGGMGNIWGSAVGALILVSLPELMKFAGFSSSAAFRARELIFGLAIVLVLMLFPKGLAGKEQPAESRVKRMFKETSGRRGS
jgi:branched-chain amino acid transport system permease protein